MKTSARLVRAASDLDEIIAIDPQGMTCPAEPGVIFTDLVAATLRYGLGVANPHPRTTLGRLLFGKFLHSAPILRLAETLHRFRRAQHLDVTVHQAEFEVTRAGTRIRYRCRRRAGDP